MIAPAHTARADSSTASMDRAERYDASMATALRAAQRSILPHPEFSCIDSEKPFFPGEIIVFFDRAMRIRDVAALRIPLDSRLSCAVL